MQQSFPRIQVAEFQQEHVTQGHALKMEGR